MATAAVSAQPMSLRERLLLAEDSRAQAPDDLAALRQGLTNRDPQIRRQSVRAIGRLEKPDLIAPLTRSLADDNVEVRIEAVNAIGQLAIGAKGVADAVARLLARAKSEGEPRVWGPIAATLGRLPYTAPADVDRVEAVIARVLPSGAATAIQIDALLGATEGLEALARQSGKISRLKAPTLDGLRVAAALEGRAQDADKLARIRCFATLALTAAGAVTRSGLDAGIADADDEVRRLTVVSARAAIDGREMVIAKGLSDRNAQVRYEALQTWSRQAQKTSCAALLQAVRDPNPHVSLLAIDLLGNGCPAHEPATTTLQSLAEVLTPQSSAWHAPAHALVSLAKVAPDEARKILPRYVSHPTWQVRMYAARAAGPVAAIEDLHRLGADSHPNVREAALGQLIALKRPEAESVAISALTRGDYQLVMTAARALSAATDQAEAVNALNAALGRISAERRDTSRDARAAILDALKQLQPATIPPSVVGSIVTPGGRRIDVSRLDALSYQRLRFVMAGRGTFDLQLLPDQAPVTALHIATLARDGYYNGLTFHRVVPNFVIQGGSPGANEYMGQGPFMRDEVGLVSHRRGTVGISTRGRDTGDAQLFINLVDSPRLDHVYTVFAEVVSGMDVVDTILEGDVIERVEIVPAPSR
ncbi:MAG TPA: peptidylprolyl isomerase [Vicinamibacterales bacterium]|nr:peptidylprolyl isomerase [Vicinamibacterales bacterium]